MQNFVVSYSQGVDNMDFGTKLKNLLDEKQMKVTELANLTGINRNTLYACVRRGSQRFDPPALKKIADALGVDVYYFLDSKPLTTPNNLIPIEQLSSKRIPIIGTISCGQPIMAEQQDDQYMDIPSSHHRADAAVIVEGDSMTPRYHHGDTVFLRLQADVDDGQIAAVVVDDSVTLKKVYHLPDGVCLVSENAAYPPMTFTSSNSDSARILGLAIGHLHWD